MDLTTILGPLGSVPHLRIQRVRRAVQGHVRPEQRARPDAHEARVEDRAARVDVHARAQHDVRAVVGPEGPVDPGL